MADVPWAQIIGGVAKGVNAFGTADKADAQMQEAYRQMLANLQARFGDYDALGKAGYQNVTAQEVGPSALETIPQDLQARQAQQEAMAKLSELAANGGLSLADMAALNEVQRNLNRGNMARQKGLANEFAARGQLGSGAQMAMGLANQQNASESANQRAESVAAQAQARALQAILQKGQMARGMGQDEYRRLSDAARAKDLIEARNAAARTGAANTNNEIAARAFQDELAKARGKTQLTGDMNKAVFGRGSQSANTTLGKGSAFNSLLDSGMSAFGSGGGGTSSGDGTSATSGTSYADYSHDADHSGDSMEHTDDEDTGGEH